MFLKKLRFELGLELYKGQKQGSEEKLKNTTQLWNDGAFLFSYGLQRNALASLVHFAVCKVS